MTATDSSKRRTERQEERSGGRAMSATEELLQAALGASADRKEDALRVLRGDAQVTGYYVASPRYEPYLTLRETAKRLGISTFSLWRWQIPGHDLGGRRRFRLSEVISYLESDAFHARIATLRALRKANVTARGSPAVKSVQAEQPEPRSTELHPQTHERDEQTHGNQTHPVPTPS